MMQKLPSLPLTADEFTLAFRRVVEDGVHLSTELQHMFKRHTLDAEQAAIIRHRFYQAVRYRNCSAAWQGKLDGVLRPEHAYEVPWLTARLANHSWLSDAPAFVRVNTLKTTVDACYKALAPYQPKLIGNDCIKIDAPHLLFTSKAFSDGWFEQQDINSQRVGTTIQEYVLQTVSAPRVIDLCAGAGGKALHLAALMQNKGHILAMDVDQVKLTQLRKRARRAGATNIETRHIDSTKVIKRQNGKADLVLVDAPCSGTGVLRRNPDILYHLKPEHLRELQSTQANLLKRASMMCKPNGYIAFVTCSILPAEGREQTESFCQTNTVRVIKEWQTQNGDSEGDGFYFCLMQIS